MRCARAAVAVVAVSALSSLSACAWQMELPPRFLRLDSSTDELKATTPDDARLWGRELTVTGDGTLDFWMTTLRHELLARGYELQREFPVTDGDGTKGQAMTFLACVEGEELGYLVALFLEPGGLLTDSDTLRLLEFVAPHDAWQRDHDAVEAAITTLRP